MVILPRRAIKEYASRRHYRTRPCCNAAHADTRHARIYLLIGAKKGYIRSTRHTGTPLHRPYRRRKSQPLCCGRPKGLHFEETFTSRYDAIHTLHESADIGKPTAITYYYEGHKKGADYARSGHTPSDKRSYKLTVLAVESFVYHSECLA